jgi:hypothetical protein
MMGMLSRFRKRQPINSDKERREFLMAHGRITDGRIIDTYEGPRGEEIAVYVYTLNGVDFESSELLSEEQKSTPLKYAPGAKVAIRYDPRNQGNSLLE